MAMATAATCYADYPYMTIRQTDGTEISVGSDGLRFNIDEDGYLVVNSTDGTMKLPLTGLASMEFTEQPAGVYTAGMEMLPDGPVKVFSTSGVALGSFDSPEEARCALSEPGVYIIKSNTGTCKIVVSK